MRTLLLYLIGDRQAILAIASDRRALWVGLLFVLSAGFAREYDARDLLAEPWYLVVPVGASLLSSFVLFVVLFLKLFRNDPNRPSFSSAYRSFLTLFWMTAPLAWLYAIPYARFLTPAEAVRANLATLGLVAAWRVVLMVRVASVLMGYRHWSAFVLVMTFADIVVLLAVWLMPIPPVDFMGGLHLSEGERITQAVGISLGFAGVILLPLWLILAVVAFFKSHPTWQVSRNDATRLPSSPVGLWLLGLASVAVWAFVLPVTQSEQMLGHRVEWDLKHGRIAEALAVMSAHEPTDFPPHWEPPPRIGYWETNPPVLDVMEIILVDPPAPWVRDLFFEKFRRFLRSAAYSLPYIREMEEKRARIARLILQFPERLPDLTSYGVRETLFLVLEEPSLSPQERERLESMLKEAEEKTRTSSR